MARVHGRSGKTTMRVARSAAPTASTRRITRAVGGSRGGGVSANSVDSPPPVRKMSPDTRAKFEQLLDQLNTATGGGDTRARS